MVKLLVSVQRTVRWLDGKEPACRCRQHGVWSLGRENDNPLRYSCPENPMDRGAWRAAVHGVSESRTRLSIERWRRGCWRSGCCSPDRRRLSVLCLGRCIPGPTASFPPVPRGALAPTPTASASSTSMATVSPRPRRPWWPCIGGGLPRSSSRNWWVPPPLAWNFLY